MTVITLGQDTSGRTLKIDARTLAKLRAAEKAIGFTFTIVQGSWRGSSGARASAGTHDRGGVIDIRTWNIPANIGPAKAVLELRKAGLIAWYRHQGQGFDPHIHAIDYGNPDLDPSAARQVTAWQSGRNGLASNGADDGPRVDIPRDPPPEEPELSNVESAHKLLSEADQLLGRALNHMKATPKRRVAVRAQVGALWTAILAVRAIRNRLPKA